MRLVIDGTGYPAHWEQFDGIGGFEVVDADQIKSTLDLLSGGSLLEFVFKDWRQEVSDVFFDLTGLAEHVPALSRECPL